MLVVDLGKWMNKILIDWGMDPKVADRFDETIIAILMIAIAVVLNYLCQAILVGGMKQYTRRKPHLWNTLLMKRKVFHNLIHTIPAILVYALLPMAFMRGKELLLISQKACAIYIIFSLLLAINGGRCENTGTLMVKGIPALSEGPLRFEEVMRNYKMVLKEIARVYNEAMNIIHYMHDKYYYEKAQMAFVDTDPRINLAYGVAGLSIALDSLSAIKYARVTARRNAEGLTEGFDIEGEFPCYGNNDDRVDHLGVDLVYYFSEELKKLPVYKNARPTLSLLTITSNVMYGKKTGATPDGRLKGVAFAPGANPMHGRDKSGAIASLASVAKMRYRDSQDGISNTFSIVPKSLGPTAEERIDNLVTMLDGYFTKGAHHLNVNVLNREMLEDAMEHPEKYPQLTIRVSGYAVNFTKLSREHQLEVISRSFHERM